MTVAFESAKAVAGRLHRPPGLSHVDARTLPQISATPIQAPARQHLAEETPLAAATISGAVPRISG